MGLSTGNAVIAYKGLGKVRIRPHILCGMSDTMFYWAIIGGGNPGVYRDWYVLFSEDCSHLIISWYTSPFIRCGHSTPPLPFAIQCISLDEARDVATTLQDIVVKLSATPDHNEANGNQVQLACLARKRNIVYKPVVYTLSVAVKA